MEELYQFMTTSAKKLQLFTNEMVTEKPISGKNLSYFGASMSYQYDKLSQASVQVVQHNLRSFYSRKLRESVLNVGQLCLELIKQMSNIKFISEDSTMVTKTSLTSDYAENICEELENIIGIVNILEVNFASPNQNAYRDAANSVKDVLSNFQIFEKPNQEQLQEHVNEITIIIMQEIIRTLQVLYHTLKMAISNLVSSSEESVLASLENITWPIDKVTKKVLDYADVAKKEDIQVIESQTRKTIQCTIALLIVFEEVSGRTERRHNKEILKIAWRDAVESIGKLSKEATNMMIRNSL